jgi:tRNA A37 threonylcarbamoyladenosine dehydratase
MDLGATTDGQSADLERRFGALARLYGTSGAAAVFASHVVVVGIGGVGSWASEALARSGVCRLTLIDMDHVAESNVNRQIHALSTTLGQAKALAMKQRIALINPMCDVQVIDDFVSAENWSTMAQSMNGVSAVIDACDQVRAKLTMAAWALKTKTLFITVGAAGGKRHADRVQIKDLIDVTHDPLLSQLRYRMRKEKHLAPAVKKSKIHCVFSQEEVLQPGSKSQNAQHLHPNECSMPAQEQSAGQGFSADLNCHGYGSSVAVTATFGMCAASWVMDRLALETQFHTTQTRV